MISIEDCIKSIMIDPDTGEYEVAFKDNQTPEEVECIKQYILDAAVCSEGDIEIEQVNKRI
ncbi:MAG: hypothetical protein RR744_09895 [Cellulosilyticaceae bacterium]